MFLMREVSRPDYEQVNQELVVNEYAHWLCIHTHAEEENTKA